MKLGIVELITLLLKVWLANNIQSPFKRINEINSTITSMSLNASESELLQIEQLGKERDCITKLVGTIHADICNKC